YKLIRLLGEGGMGAVYEAEHQQGGERVAVKVLHPRLLASDKKGIQRFRREAKAAGGIESDHIVRVIDSGDDDATGVVYLVMEYMAGEDLQRVVDRVGALTPDVALRIAAQGLRRSRPALARRAARGRRAFRTRDRHRPRAPRRLAAHFCCDGRCYAYGRA